MFDRDEIEMTADGEEEGFPAFHRFGLAVTEASSPVALYAPLAIAGKGS
jgi:hypothetical protein